MTDGKIKAAIHYLIFEGLMNTLFKAGFCFYVSLVIVSAQTANEAMLPPDILEKTQKAYDALTSYSDSGTVADSTGRVRATFSIHAQRPNLFKIMSRHFPLPGLMPPFEINVWSAGAGTYCNDAGEISKIDDIYKTNSMFLP